MKAEADAAAAANRKLAADKMRRREQQSLVARGAPSLGDEQNTGQGVINTGSAMNPRNLIGRIRYQNQGSSLVSRGAPGGSSGGGGSGGGGGMRSATTVY